MKIAAIICGVIAALGFVSATSTVFLGGANRPADETEFISYAIGAYLFPVMFLIASVWLLQRSQKPPEQQPPA